METSLPKSSPLEASAKTLANVFNAFFDVTKGDPQLLDSLFTPVLTAEAKKLGVPPEDLMAEIHRVCFGEDTVLNDPDAPDAPGE